MSSSFSFVQLLFIFASVSEVLSVWIFVLVLEAILHELLMPFGQADNFNFAGECRTFSFLGNFFLYLHCVKATMHFYPIKLFEAPTPTVCCTHLVPITLNKAHSSISAKSISGGASFVVGLLCRPSSEFSPNDL